MTDTSQTVSTSLSLPIRVVHGAIVGALEGGSRYWLHGAAKLEGYEKPGSSVVWWGHQEFFKQPFSFEAQFEDPNLDEGNNEGRRTLSNCDLNRAVSTMVDKAPRHFADLKAGNGDATTYDVFMQCLVLDDIVFG
ncbi:hypothetical protein [Bosea sp. RAC05]|uniref:hypothetical protein n=1 Tax=Bosea sp. RAC05 TaxID=1842539 RepID=UPI00083CE19E|nr:hypothetical protein [Bosea sp. RAC05]AOG03458.1 hypothetical protein BSY19_5142 [Bosea sp. RAC05]